MDQVFNFLFGTRLGVGVLFFAGIVIFGIAAFILEKRTHKMYRKQDSAMDQVFNFLFGTRLGVGVLFFAGIVIFGIAAFILEKRTHKMYVDRGPKGDDEDSFWN